MKGGERNIKPVNCKKEFDELVKKCGFENRHQFALSVGISPQSIDNNLVGRYGLSVERCIKLANGLKVPVDTIIGLFYPSLMESNLKYHY